MASTRWLAIVAGAIALMVVAGVAVTVLASSERHYAEGTPERTVQDYLRAVSDHDATAALSYLAPELAAQCEPKPRDGISNRGATSLRAVLDRSTLREGTAEIRVDITEVYDAGSPFGGGESNFTKVFTLKQVDGRWRFVEPPWPIFCPRPPPPAR